MFSIIILISLLFTNLKPVKKDKVGISLGILALWFVALYILSRCQMGFNYICNIFFCIIVYLACLMSLKKEDIPFLFKVIRAVLILNLILLFSQALGYDPIFNIRNIPDGTDLIGFFGLKACMGMYFGLAMPLMAVFCWWLPIFLIIPLGISLSTGAFLGGIAGYLFYLWFKKRKIFLIAMPVIIVCALFFIVKIDSPMGMFGTRPPMWKMVVKDAFRSPITGYGLDSFRLGDVKYFKEATNNHTVRAVRESDKWRVDTEISQPRLDFWDSSHCEYIQILFEAGVVGLGICLFIIYFLARRFKVSYKTDNLVAIGGFFVALLVMSTVQFPLHLARLGHLFPVMLALLKIESDDGK